MRQHCCNQAGRKIWQFLPLGLLNVQCTNCLVNTVNKAECGVITNQGWLLAHMAGAVVSIVQHALHC